MDKATRHYLAARFGTWKWWAVHGGSHCPEMVDEEEAIFGEVDELPGERVQARGTLRGFLCEGQRKWRRDGGVNWSPTPPDAAIERDVRPLMARAEKRRPQKILEVGEDPLGVLGRFWELSDFAELEAQHPALWEELVECRRLEDVQLTYMTANGTFLGDCIDEAGCRALGIPEEVIREWVDGVKFEVSPELEPYSREPYATLYSSMDILLMGVRDYNRLLSLGKVFPIRVKAYIETRTTAVVKKAPLEPSGVKWRTCYDSTVSGLNAAVETIPMTMPTCADIIGKMGPGSLIVKQDLRDMFYSFKLHPTVWTYMGFRHPLTGQTYLMPVLPMGFCNSPPLACRNTERMAAIISEEMWNRWEGRPGLPALAHIPTPSGPREGVCPASTCYVDDFCASAPPEWMEALVEVGARVFELIGVTEKKTKREGPAPALPLLGFLFDVETHQLSIPHTKCTEMLALLDRVIGRGERRQSVSWQELASLVGRLTWASSGVELGRAYLREVRKPLVAVIDMLKTRRKREEFCIPLYRFEKATEELQWWRDALGLNSGSQRWFVGEDGRFQRFRWTMQYGVPMQRDVLQFSTDASRWGGGGEYEFERVVRRWTAGERRHHRDINALEGLMVLDFVARFAEAWRGQSGGVVR